MNIFKTNKIVQDNEIVAEILRNRRKEKNISLEKVSQEIDIHIKYLKALESGDFSAMPSGVYGKNFLKEYALFLGINYKELLEILDDKNYFSDFDNKENIFSRQRTKRKDFLFFPKIIKNILIALIVFSCFIYVGISLRKIITPPNLYISSPAENITIHENNINIIGTTDPGAIITINGEIINSNSDGDFNKNINLKNGINIIKISAKKKYSQETTLERYVLVEP